MNGRCRVPDRKPPETVHRVSRHIIVTGSLPPGYGAKLTEPAMDQSTGTTNHVAPASDVGTVESISSLVVATLQDQGWLFVGNDISRRNGISIYNRFTTDGNPPNDDYDWGPSRIEDHTGEFIPASSDVRHCTIRVSDHVAKHYNVRVFLVVDADGVSCSAAKNGRQSRPQILSFSDFGLQFQRFVNERVLNNSRKSDTSSDQGRRRR